MKIIRNFAAALAVLSLSGPALAADRAALEAEVLTTWYRLVLELVRHTPTYSPPVASRSFAYVGVIAHEAEAAGDASLVSLAGQLNELTALPQPEAGQDYDDAVVLNAALGQAMIDFFGNTGPTGQRALQAMTADLTAKVTDGLDADTVSRSTALGLAIAAHVQDWSQADGGAVVTNMGFPMDYTPGTEPDDWVPTSTIQLQQAPLLPGWGDNRPFAMPVGHTCKAPPHPDFSTDPGSEFYANALKVHDTVANLTPEQMAIARFWSDDPMLSPTPPGHWVSIILQIADRDHLSAEQTASALAVTGIAVADAFIGCWHEKFLYNLIRPVTYIKRHIDAAWEPLLITPPFPEYPSGHSVQSGAAEVALTALFGENFAFDDATHEDDGIDPRHFDSFKQAAEEAAISRLYGGIHYPFANTGGLQQGRCIGAFAAQLKTRS